MASIISHAAAGAALSIAFAPDGTPTRYWPVAIAAAVLPDADSLLYYFRYYPTLGHRGFFHSPFLGLMLRIAPEIHAKALVMARPSGKSLNQWAAEVLAKAAHSTR